MPHLQDWLQDPISASKPDTERPIKKVPPSRRWKDAVIYLTLEPDSDEQWTNTLGLMPPPYALGITLLVHEDSSCKSIRDKALKQIFQDMVPDPLNSSLKISRAALANRHGIRIVEAGVEAISVSDILTRA